MNTETEEFRGWEYDAYGVRAFTPLVVRTIGIYLATVPFILVVGAAVADGLFHIPISPWIYRICIPVFFTGLALLFVFLRLKKTVVPSCRKCRGAMKMIETIPTDSEIAKRAYIKGDSGHAYTQFSSEGGQHDCEVRKQWYGCDRCRLYYLVDAAAQEVIGWDGRGITERENAYKRSQEARRSLAGKKVVLKK